MEIDLKRDLQTRGCPVCDHLENAAFAHFSRFQFDWSQDERIRKRFAHEGGLCPFHTWQLAAFSSSRGLAKGLPPLLSRTANQLLQMANLGDEAHFEQTVSGESRPNCRVCALCRHEEEVYLTRLIRFLDQGEGLSIYANSHGVCLLHLRLLVKSVPRETARYLLRQAAQRLREAETHLRSYDQKLESGNRHDCTPNEKTADRLALIHIAGAKYLSFPLK